MFLRKPVYGEVWNVGEVIAVLSGKGGTGKTSLCAALGTNLAAAGYRVLCVDADVGLRNLDISLGLSETVSYTHLPVMLGHDRRGVAVIHGHQR